MSTIAILNLEPIVHLSDEQFEKLCWANPEAKLERNAKGELIIMSPTGGESGQRNRKLTQRLGNWTDEDGTGESFDSSTMFRLPNGALRSPDAAWVTLTRWNQLTLEQKRGFVPLAPDFVAELRSWSDNREDLQAKMEEYLANGVRLGWLIDPIDREVDIYRIGKNKETLSNPTQLLGEEVLPGFILSLSGIFA
jgi:Uma2 family endonuclease